MAIRVPPTACAVVPPGTGTLNIITTKEKAAKTESSGTFFAVSVLLTFLADRYQTGALAAYMTPHVDGLK